ncbi:Porin B precursor [compost metagenome]
MRFSAPEIKCASTAFALFLSVPATCIAETTSTSMPWMLGTWGGLRDELHQKGVDFDLNYRSDSAYNAHGGYDKDKKLAYADQYMFSVSADLDKLLGASSSKFVMTLIDRNGEELAKARLTDPRSGSLTQTQNVYGRGSVTRLSQLYLETRLGKPNSYFRMGRFGPEEFGQFDCDFQNLIFCGNSGGNWHGDDWYNFPIGQWATAVKYQFLDDVAVQAGVFEQNPTLLENDNAFKVSTRGAEGALIPAEVIWTPKRALFGQPAEFRLGAFYNTTDADDLRYNADGHEHAFEPDTRYQSHRGRKGWWYVARQTVGHVGGDQHRKIEVFSEGFWNDRDTGFVARHYNIGLIINGPFVSRPDDSIGVAIGGLSVASNVTAHQRHVNIYNQVTRYDDPRFTPVQTDEYSSEIYYGVKITDWLTVRPNVQYIVHPGAVDEVDNAFLLGLMVRASF